MCWNTWSSGRKKDVKKLIFEIFILEWKNTPRGVKGLRAATLYRKLPPKVSEIRTILQYKEEPDKRSVKNPKIAEKKYTKCWKCIPAGHPVRKQTLVNRRGAIPRNHQKQAFHYKFLL